MSEFVAMVSLQPVAARPFIWLCPPWLYQPGPPRVQWDADGRDKQDVSQPPVQTPRLQVVIGTSSHRGGAGIGVR